MPAVVDVPLNTCLADLDEALRALLKRELERHGFEGVDIAFDAPATDWSAKLTNPTVNLFLYDLRENVAEAEATHARHPRVNGAAIAAPPPMRLEVTYSVTAWTKAVQDEHRLLSQVLAILFSHVSLPADLLEGRLASASLLRAIETEVGRPKEEKADFWTSIGGRYKASIDYAVKLEVESGLTFTRGPEVRSQTVRLGLKDGPRAHDRGAPALRRHRARQGRRAGRQRVGGAARPRALRLDQRRGPVHLRRHAAGRAQASRPARRRARRRAARPPCPAAASTSSWAAGAASGPRRRRG